MKSILEYIAEYLASKLSLVLSESMTIVKMPETPTICVCVYDVDTDVRQPAPQIDAEVHYIRIRVRNTTYLAAVRLAMLTAGYMQTDSVEYPNMRLSDIDTTGILNFADGISACVTILSQPHAPAADTTQSNERVVEFTCKVITQKLS